MDRAASYVYSLYSNNCCTNRYIEPTGGPTLALPLPPPHHMVYHTAFVLLFLSLGNTLDGWMALALRLLFFLGNTSFSQIPSACHGPIKSTCKACGRSYERLYNDYIRHLRLYKPALTIVPLGVWERLHTRMQSHPSSVVDLPTLIQILLKATSSIHGRG